MRSTIRWFGAMVLASIALASPFAPAVAQVCKADLGGGGCMELDAVCTVRSGVKGVCHDVAVPRGELRCACEENTVFTLSVGNIAPSAVSAGQSASATVSVAAIKGKGYNGVISLSCSVLGVGSGLGCSTNPSRVNISSDGAAVTSVLSISTSATTSPGAYALRLTAVDANGAGPGDATPTLGLAVVTKGVQNVSLVRELSSANTFLVVGDTKFFITNPAEFQALGFNSSKVRIVPDGALASFTEDRLHATPGIKPSDVFFDCQNASPFPRFGTFYGNCKPSTSIVRKDVLVAGWLKPGMPYVNYSAPGAKDPNTGKSEIEGLEDIHYNLILDAAFLDRMYGSSGLSNALTNAVWPGNIDGNPAPTSIPFATSITPEAPAAVTFNSWILPCSSDEIHGELNAWHVNDTNPGGWFTVHWLGRGQQPAFWINPFPAADPQALDNDAWFPFNPLDPTATGHPLRGGDYIMMRGTLWQENWHSGCEPDPSWGLAPTPGQDGISEMHPPDWIERVLQPNPNARLTTGHIALVSPAVTGPQVSGDLSVSPDFPPSSPSRKLLIRSAQHMVDSRFTNTGTIVAVNETPAPDHVDVHVVIQPTGTQQARFKASWLVGWAEVDEFDRVWVDDQIPAGASPHGDGEGWDWRADNVFTGKVSHESALAAGIHQHYFDGATVPLQVHPFDSLFAMVFLDPNSPPDEVMLQWHTPTGWVRAYWGTNLIDWGVNATPERAFIGPLPPTGEWVRLEVPAQALGILSTAVMMDGMAFTLSGGRAVWDYAGVNNGAQLTVLETVTPRGALGTFDLQIDGTTKASNVTGRGSTGLQNVSAGPHKVGEVAGTSTTLSDFAITFAGDCDANGNVIVASGQNKFCAITNTALRPKCEQPGFTPCGSICVNISSDLNNCGACGKSCGSARGISCIDGSCESICPPNSPNCVRK